MTVVPAATGVLLDQLLGEPPVRWHPVARFGSTMRCLEDHLYADRRLNGAVFTIIGVSAAIGTGLAVRTAVGRNVSTAIAATICVAGRMLDAEAGAVAQLLADDDQPGARVAVRSLVGRITDDLDATDLSRAVVESLAENEVDAVTASLFWGMIGGAPAIFAHRAVNTLDAMVGHHDQRYERFGWASARLDDLANYMPARLTTFAVALARPTRSRAIWRTVRADAGQHPSPNGGVIEAAFAAALDVQLGGTNRYADHVEHRGTLGNGPPPEPRTITEAIRLRRHTTAATITLLALITSTIRRLRSR